VILTELESALNVEPFIKTTRLTVTQDNDALAFSAVGESRDTFKQIEFNGEITRGITPDSEGQPNDSLIIKGSITWDGASSQTIFIPVVDVPDAILAEYEGVYHFESGRALSILVSPEYTSGGLTFFSQSLMLTDFDSGALRSLYPTSDASFLVGVLRDVGAPFAGRIEFTRDEGGKVNGLRWWDTPHDLLSSPVPSEFASRINYTIEDHVEFNSQDGTKLAGRLSIPNSDSTVPAFMMLHGSEQGTHDNFGNKVMAHYMISRGFAILNYDKRGVGDSEGTYQEAPSPANLQRLADDAIAGATYLATRPEVDTERIGLIGGSQAGWVIPLAASQSELITHMVIYSGPVCSISHEDFFSSYTNDGDSATKYDDAEVSQRLRNLSPGGFDTIPIIAGLNQPGLWLWGSVDKSVPVTYSAENLQALIDSGRDNFSYEIFPRGDHNLNESPHGLFAEIPYSPRVLFYSTLAKWLETNMSVPKE
jgi:pimeloyl-ACP methyl ester carboxylesterase